MKHRICVRCKEDLQPPVSNKQKYCKDCAFVVHLEQMRHAAKKKRQLTTGTFGSNPIKRKDGTINYRAEHKAIQREMVKLGLRGKHA